MKMNKYFLLLIIAAVSFAQGKSVIAVARMMGNHESVFIQAFQHLEN